MNRFIIKITTFLFLIILVNFGYLLFIQATDWNFSKRIEALNLVNPKYDVLVFGNSLAMDGVDAEYLSRNGFNTYNTALGGSSLKTNYIQLKEYLSNYEYKPKIIILGLGTYLNNFESEDVNPIVDYTRQGKKFTVQDIPLLKFRWLFKEQLKKIVSKSHREAYLKKGQLRFKKKVSDKSEIIEKQFFPLDKYLSSEILKSIINLCTENNIKLVILEMPGFKKTRHEKFSDCIIIDPKAQNGFLFDFNYYEFGNNFDDNRDWIGNSHLNEYGARKFTKHIISVLEKESIIGL